MAVKREEARLEGAELMTILCLVTIVAGVAVLWMAMQNRRHIRELEHRERLAMIDRGLVPPPELDPEQFERGTGVGSAGSNVSAARFRTLGVIMIGCGLALMMIIGFAGDAPRAALGVGGAFAVLGAAFFFNGKMMSRVEPFDARPRVPHVPVPRQQPPVERQSDRQPEP
jgi:hypothetical protein